MQANSAQRFIKSIIATFCYFDIFHHPLTLLELKKYLINLSGNADSRIISNKKLFNTLQYLRNKQVIQSKNGFYFLKNKKQNFSLRSLKHLYSQKLWKKAYFISKVISRLPFVRMIAVCNTLAMNNITSKSDIDLFIIIKNDYIWTARFFITLAVSVLGLRRHKKKIAQRVCLSFYITQRAMNLKKITINLQQMPDIYFIYWFASLSPLFSEKETQENFFKKNIWIKNYLLNFYPYQPILYRRKVKLGVFSKKIKTFLESLLLKSLGQKLEKFLKELQFRKMSKNYWSKEREKNTDVIISDNILKFHEADRRREYRNRFLEKLKIVKF